MSDLLSAEEVCAWFDATHPLGTPVTAFPGAKEGRAIQGETRSPAWVVGGSPVVAITGYAGGIALSHVVCAMHAEHAIEVDARAYDTPRVAEARDESERGGS